MIAVIMFVIGFIAGCVVTIIVCRIKSVGSLRIDTSDPEDDPYLFLELSKDLLTVSRKKYVSIKIIVKNFISQK